MEWDLSIDGEATTLARRSPRRRRWLEIALITGFVFCLFVGMSALGLMALLLRAERAELAASPLSTLPIESITTHLALRELEGVDGSALAAQSLRAGELDTSLALLLFDTRMSGTERAGLLVELAQRYLERGERERAAQLFWRAQSIALLDPGTNGLARVAVMTESTQGLLAAGRTSAARRVVINAKQLSVALPELLPIQRSRLFSNLLPLVRELNDPLLERQLDELVGNPYVETNGIAVPPWRPVGQPLDVPQAVLTTTAARVNAANVLAERALLTNNLDVEPERQALAVALLAEDGARSDWVRIQTDAGLSLEQRLWLLQEQRAWQARKLQVAYGAYGLSIVPEWETEREALLESLFNSTVQVKTVADGLIAAQPTPADQAVLRTSVLYWLALQVESGLYPNRPLADLGVQLRYAQEEMSNQGVSPALLILFDPDADPPGFFIQSTSP